MYRRSKQPLGQATRGKTADNRLRSLDIFLLACEPGLLRRRDDSAFVDLGFGFDPRTTLESAGRLRALNPRLDVVGVEIDPERVAGARPFEDTRTRFVRGGFDYRWPRPARVLRAMNVLRQYPAEAVPDAWAELGAHLAPGGLLIEGTSDPLGRLVVVNLLRRVGGGLRHEGLLFFARPTVDFSPLDYRAVLPKDQIHRVQPGEDIHRLLHRWDEAWRRAGVLAPFGVRQVFREAARQLAQSEPLDRRRWLARSNYILWNEHVRT